MRPAALPLLTVVLMSGCANLTAVREFAQDTRQISAAFDPLLGQTIELEAEGEGIRATPSADWRVIRAGKEPDGPYGRPATDDAVFQLERKRIGSCAPSPKLWNSKGATPALILRQFLVEAAILGLLLTGTPLGLPALIGLLMLIGWRGLVYFWPHTIYEWHITEHGKQEVVIGELYDDELVPSARIRAMGVELPANVDEVLTRYLVKTGNREFVPLDFLFSLS